MLINFIVLIYHIKYSPWLAVFQVRELNGQLGESLIETQATSKKQYYSQIIFCARFARAMRQLSKM